MDTIRVEQDALETLAAAFRSPDLQERFTRAVDAIVSTQGRLIVTGIGKSGLVGRKIAATMTSTGTPSVYVHPSEASHGDLGTVTTSDVVLALSWSGETNELGDIIAYCRRFGVMLIVATSCANSTAARAADICLALPPVQEACPNRLAPTSSTTVQTVLGDALAVALVRQRGFSAVDFRVFHPGGQLGARLLTVAQLMGTADQVPVVGTAAAMIEATMEMSRKRYGATAVVDDHGKLVGVFTDGDLRRCIASSDMNGTVLDHMSPQPLTVSPTLLCSDALRIMNENAVSVLFVCEDQKLVGAIHLHDLLRVRVA